MNCEGRWGDVLPDHRGGGVVSVTPKGGDAEVKQDRPIPAAQRHGHRSSCAANQADRLCGMIRVRIIASSATFSTKIGGLMVPEITRDWPTKPKPVQTPMETTTGSVLARKVTLVPILHLPRAREWRRTCLKLLPEARGWGIWGCYRDEKDLGAGDVITRSCRRISRERRKCC